MSNGAKCVAEMERNLGDNKASLRWYDFVYNISNNISEYLDIEEIRYIAEAYLELKETGYDISKLSAMGSGAVGFFAGESAVEYWSRKLSAEGEIDLALNILYRRYDIACKESIYDQIKWLKCIGEVYYEARRYNEASKTLKSVYELCGDLPDERTTMVLSMLLLAKSYYRQGLCKESLEYYRRVYNELIYYVSEPGYDFMAEALEGMAKIYGAQGEMIAAYESYEKLFRKLENSLDNYPNAVESLEDYAALCEALGKDDMAKELRTKAGNIRIGEILG